MRQRSGKETGRRQQHGMVAATWSVRSLMEDTGDPKMCRGRGSSRSGGGADRKLDYIAAELSKHCIDIAIIQERRWFGCDVWPASDGMCLHSGRPLPTEGESKRRNEGVGFYLFFNSQATAM